MSTTCHGGGKPAAHASLASGSSGFGPLLRGQHAAQLTGQARSV
jgi:hypothetical protein